MSRERARRQPSVHRPAATGAVGQAQISLVDLLDRLLGTGVVLAGDVLISLAGVDLVQVRLHALITTVRADLPQPRHTWTEGHERRPPGACTQRMETDPDSVERDLFKLVLTIIELVRQLMEAQALRRVDEGDLSDAQVEALGLGLSRLEEAMEDLKSRYDLTTADLNIDLGPAGQAAVRRLLRCRRRRRRPAHRPRVCGSSPPAVSSIRRCTWTSKRRRPPRTPPVLNG